MISKGKNLEKTVSLGSVRVENFVVKENLKRNFQ